MIPQNSLVLYKTGPARVTALGEKLEIELADGRALRVRPKDVQLLHPGPLRSLRELEPLPSGETEAACELLDGGQTTLAELAELVYGACTPATAWASWRLIEEGLYFQGTPEQVSARPLAEVEQERSTRAAKAAERAAWNGFLERARAGRLAPQDAPYLREVEELAWGQREQSRVLQTLECAQTPESAHALLLRLEHWQGADNPYPQRIGVALSAPALPLPEALPEEQRVDLTGLPAYAIDDEGNLDPDDALSIDGDRLWVHVADAAALVSTDSAVDQEARGRGATLYLPELTAPMLPVAAVERLGLGLAEISPALSFGLSLDDAGEVIDIEIVSSWVRVQRLSYATVETRLDQEPFRRLDELARRHRARRAAAGAIFIDLPEVKMQVVEGRVSIAPLPRLRSRTLVSEAMLMAGVAAARFALARGLPFPFTTQAVADPVERSGGDARPAPQPAPTPVQQPARPAWRPGSGGIRTGDESLAPLSGSGRPSAVARRAAGCRAIG